MSGLAQIIVIARSAHGRAIPFRSRPGFRSCRRAIPCRARSAPRRARRAAAACPHAAAAASNRLRSRAGPMWRTGSSIRSAIKSMVTSPEVAMASNASGATPSLTNWRRIGRGGPRRVGDQDHRPAAAAERGERVGRRGKRGDAVVDHAPDVAEKDIVAIGDLREAADLANDPGLVLAGHCRPG